jgi:SAM-dependent methyltransferase
VTSASGAIKIVRFNWPWYAGAAAVLLAGAALLGADALGPAASAALAAVLLVAAFWLVTSIAVSHFVYDRSPVSRGGWLDRVDASRVRRAAVFHAGVNEAASTVNRRLANADVRTFDFYDASRNGTPSLVRGRAIDGSVGERAAADGIPLEDGAIDLGLVVFAAHEIRDAADRARFFRELARSLAPEGRILVVEHLRDAWNLLAYGPGAFHFLSRRTWRRSFTEGGLRLIGEEPCTPFVRVFELGVSS